MKDIDILLLVLLIMILIVAFTSCSSGNLSNQEQDDYIKQYKLERAF